VADNNGRPLVCLLASFLLPCSPSVSPLVFVTYSSVFPAPFLLHPSHVGYAVELRPTPSMFYSKPPAARSAVTAGSCSASACAAPARTAGLFWGSLVAVGLGALVRRDRTVARGVLRTEECTFLNHNVLNVQAALASWRDTGVGRLALLRIICPSCRM